MKKVFLILTVAALSCSETGKTQSQETTQAADTVKTFQVSTVIENIFYNLPLEKSRLELREVILNDKRFTLTDTTFNDFPPPTFFKGIASDKGLYFINPDSTEICFTISATACNEMSIIPTVIRNFTHHIGWARTISSTSLTL